MRKMKKINGYLVVRFNDREKRLYEGTGLGNYGVIDAELYTGSLKLDRRDMKYDSVDTLEEAAELARSLEAEVDLSGEPATCAVIVETGDSYSERKVEPERMVRNWEDELVKQIGSAGCPGTDSRTASYALYGYTAALCDLGFLPEDRCSVDPGAFGRYDTREKIQSYVCDELCRHRYAGNIQEELDAACDKCQIGQLPERISAASLLRLETHCSEPPVRDNFKHTGTSPGAYPPTPQLYSLGLALETDCPNNDCTIYRNVFRISRELDDALDDVQGYAVSVLRRGLLEQIGHLRKMYRENYAVRQYLIKAHSSRTDITCDAEEPSSGCSRMVTRTGIEQKNVPISVLSYA